MWKVDQDFNIIGVQLSYIVDSLESNIISLQTDLDGQLKALMELQRSHGALCKELELKAEIIDLGISRENELRCDNDSLLNKAIAIMWVNMLR